VHRIPGDRCVRFGVRFLIVGWAATPLVAHGTAMHAKWHGEVLGGCVLHP